MAWTLKQGKTQAGTRTHFNLLEIEGTRKQGKTQAGTRTHFNLSEDWVMGIEEGTGLFHFDKLSDRFNL